MTTLDIILLLSSTIFLILLILVSIKCYYIKKDIKSFREQIKEVRLSEREQPLSVASFDTNTVDLANEINYLIKDLKDMARRAKQSEKNNKLIMAGVSHDFRTPLTTVDGYLQLINETLEECDIFKKDDKNSNMIIGQFNIINEKIKYLKLLSEEFFDVTYINALEKDSLSNVRFDKIISEVLMDNHDWMKERDLETIIDIPDEAIYVKADEHNLRRIIDNLFTNVKKYAQNHLDISVNISNDEVILTIINDLDNMLEFDVNHIFEPFYRAKGRSGPGAGLGLYVCKELANAMNFKISGDIKNNNFSIVLNIPTK